MINNDELDAKLEKSPAPRVTPADINARIVATDYTRLTPTVTICNITLDNGFSVRGESACVNLDNYDQEIGERISHDNAFNQLWPLFGFLLAEKNFNNRNNPVQEPMPKTEAA